MSAGNKHKRLILFLLFTLLLFSSATVITFFVIKDGVSPNNHNYPVYNLFDLTLNNQTKNDLIAQIAFFNKTANKWVPNQQLIDLVKKDMETFETSMTKLAEVYLFSINYTILPGTLHFLLVTKFSNARRIVHKIVSEISTDVETWWFVENISYPLIDLDYISFENTFKYNVIDTIDIVLGHVLYFENGTTSTTYRRQDGLVAALWIFNGTHWILNEEFIQLVINDIQGIEERIYSIEDLNVTYLTDDLGQKPETDVFCTHIIVNIHYKNHLNQYQKLKSYFLLFTILERFWYPEYLSLTIKY
ncbi:MAG: hypothetical protein ACTSSG_11525 [Candidatus Heimdallarchaeaceae archaeon]